MIIPSDTSRDDLGILQDHGPELRGSILTRILKRTEPLFAGLQLNAARREMMIGTHALF
jgi:hypothetical protein